MKFLVDHQLPVALNKFLEARGFEARHVLDLNLDQASDRTIVEYAHRNEFVIITKDEDFSVLAALGSRLLICPRFNPAATGGRRQTD